METDSESKTKSKLLHLLEQVTSLPGLVSIAVILAMFFVYIFAQTSPGQVGIANVAYARGMITLLFAVGTVMIALLLTLCAIFQTGDEAKDRFDRGKEVLSLLIGIFGTIIGFYFGSATQNQVPALPEVDQTQQQSPKIKPLQSNNSQTEN